MFAQSVGGLISELRRRHASIRAYGEMVDILWQDGNEEGAIMLEQFWNELAKLQPFSLFCAYRMDPLEAGAYGALEAICKVHTHLIPARDYARLDDAVAAASKEVLEEAQARMLLSLAAQQRPAAKMPLGQAVLFWLQKNMPRTAEKVLPRVKARCGAL